VSVIGYLHKQLREKLMYLAQFYTNTVNTPSYPQKRFDCGQSDHMKTCTLQVKKQSVNHNFTGQCVLSNVLHVSACLITIIRHRFNVCS